MLFPPPGVKIRRTLETFFLTDQPAIIAEHDSRRALLTVSGDSYNVFYASLAGNREGLSTPTPLGFSYFNQYYFYGSEEVWALCFFPNSPPGGNMLVQSVFYD